MSDNKTVVQKNGISAAGVLGIIFVVLKLLGISAVASWSWLWVLSPFWIPLALVLLILGVVVAIAAIAR